MVMRKCIEDSSLAEEVDRNWSEVLEQNYLFDRPQREVSVYNFVVFVTSFDAVIASLLLSFNAF